MQEEKMEQSFWFKAIYKISSQKSNLSYYTFCL